MVIPSLTARNVAGFPERNGLEFHAGEAEVVLNTLAWAACDMTEAADADWMKSNANWA